MVFFMGKRFDTGSGPPLPPRIKAAFDYLDHARTVTAQWDVSIPARELTPLDQSVKSAALRALQQYLLGEMDFAESAPAVKGAKSEGEQGGTSSPTGCTP
jgi:hypothetical protein